MNRLRRIGDGRERVCAGAPETFAAEVNRNGRQRDGSDRQSTAHGRRRRNRRGRETAGQRQRARWQRDAPRNRRVRRDERSSERQTKQQHGKRS